MPSPDPHRQPAGVLLGEQFRLVGLAMFREILLAAVALLFICVLSVAMALRYHEQLDVVPEILQPAIPLAVLLPFAVWKGDRIFGRAFLWTLPVRRQHAAAARVLAGALWLMLAMLVALAMLSIVALVSGGSVGVSGVRLVGETPATAARIAWSTPWWMWIMPFTGALILYLFSSALLLGLRRPVWWVAGTAIGSTMLFAALATIGPEGMAEHAVEPVLDAIWSGQAGLDFALTNGSSTLAREVERPGPGTDILWNALPDATRWAWATLLWLGLALLALALAIRRHWER